MEARNADTRPGPLTAGLRLSGLSSGELEVLQLVSRGSTNSEIGDDLGLSVHAVKFRLASVYRKLGVSNRTEAAVRYASELETHEATVAESRG